MDTHRPIFVVGLALIATLGVSTARAAPPWEEVTRSDGIVVTQRASKSGFPTFRGVGKVQASIFEVLAVLRDTPRFPKWMDRCAEARMLQKVNEQEYIVYMRTDAPWPVSDRDAVYHSKVILRLDKNMVDIQFWAERSPLQGPVDGVVRMTKLRGHWRLTATKPDETLIDYQVDADPEGSLPRWLAKLATKRLPLGTIRSLRKQTKRTRGWYKTRIARWQQMARKLMGPKPTMPPAKAPTPAKGSTP